MLNNPLFVTIRDTADATMQSKKRQQMISWPALYTLSTLAKWYWTGSCVALSIQESHGYFNKYPCTVLR